MPTRSVNGELRRRPGRVIFQKMQVVVQKNVGETIPQLRHVSRAREQRAAGCCKNAAIQVHEKHLDAGHSSRKRGFIE